MSKPQLKDKQEIIHLLNLIQCTSKRKKTDSSQIIPICEVLHQDQKKVSCL
ncbi:hypothetical protein SAMN04489762_3432 [Terribacillus saccharophilus]|uniref:Fur-regulated basic protein FbpA n=1 Tax=Terribacillus saccharophilus TaxID=361277 RepID=A0AAX2EJS8_9BACI|nr:hypothetical protein SAMN04489762_3432 [Terribacillus saccharophilus]